MTGYRLWYFSQKKLFYFLTKSPRSISCQFCSKAIRRGTMLTGYNSGCWKPLILTFKDYGVICSLFSVDQLPLADGQYQNSSFTQYCKSVFYSYSYFEYKSLYSTGIRFWKMYKFFEKFSHCQEHFRRFSIACRGITSNS